MRGYGDVPPIIFLLLFIIFNNIPFITYLLLKPKNNNNVKHFVWNNLIKLFTHFDIDFFFFIKAMTQFTAAAISQSCFSSLNYAIKTFVYNV